MTSIVFFGSSPYSLPVLAKLLSLPQYRLVGVVTKPDKPVGRQQTITPNPVADFAQKHHLNLIQTDVFDQNFTRLFSQLKPDLGLVVAFGPPFFTQELIDVPVYKIVNIHPSPLPKYRGATPGPWQIINGETTSAITFFQIDSLPDHGPVIRQIPFPISANETADSFYHKAFSLASSHLSQILSSYLTPSPVLTPQLHSQKSYYPKFTKETAQIDWNWPPEKIERFIRALNPWPIAWTYVSNQKQQKLRLKIFSARLINQKIVPDLVQIEGKKIVSWQEISSSYQI